MTTATVKTNLVIKIEKSLSKPEQIKDEPSEAVLQRLLNRRKPMEVEENPMAESKPDNEAKRKDATDEEKRKKKVDDNEQEEPTTPS